MTEGMVKGIVKGIWSDTWEPVVDAFARNFSEAGEKGAALCIYQRGEPVVNIWAGVRDNATAGIIDMPWQEETCVNIYSVGKALVAVCVLQLVARGKLELDKPVAFYWPEFAQEGKAQITIRQVMCHRTGLSAFRSLLEYEDIFDWDKMIDEISALKPWWEPGTAQGYSPFIYGWILGELVRRVSGCASFDDYFQREVAVPLGIRCQFGVSPEHQANVADTAPLKNPQGLVVTSSGADSMALGKIMKADPRGVTNRAFGNPVSFMTATNSAAWRQAQIPAANGHTNARAIASIFGALANGGYLANVTLLPPEQLAWCSQEQTAEDDRVLGLPLRFSVGFMLPQDRPDCRFGRGAQAFGHPGAGGALGFADPDYGLGFGYVTSRMGQSLLIDSRAIRLIDAAYQNLNNLK
jgi:CubicO group peptidase (beta-lactamase class C family)